MDAVVLDEKFFVVTVRFYGKNETPEQIADAWKTFEKFLRGELGEKYVEPDPDYDNEYKGHGVAVEEIVEVTP